MVGILRFFRKENIMLKNLFYLTSIYLISLLLPLYYNKQPYISDPYRESIVLLIIVGFSIIISMLEKYINSKSKLTYGSSVVKIDK